MSHKPLWYLKQLPPELCDAASADFLKEDSINASMGEKGEVTNEQHRDTTVRFIQPGHWFSYILHGVAHEANENCHWNYEIDGHENLQYGEYGPGQHYDWHVDVFPLGYQEKDRKISVVCLMDDPSGFEGGELSLRLYDTYVAPLTKGTVIAFPSIIEHKVTAVTSGLRHSSVVWMTGPKFK